MSSRLRAALLLGLAGAFSVSCGGIIDPSQNQMETFSGTLAVGGSNPHSFSVSKTGEISVKITALAPVSQTLAGVLWAQASNDGTCNGNILQNNNFAQLNVPAISAQIISGKYCIVVYDAGYFTAAETYTVLVSHP
jgi:hypothetical protein